MQLIFDQSVYIIEHQLKEHLIEKPEVHLKHFFLHHQGVYILILPATYRVFFPRYTTKMQIEDMINVKILMKTHHLIPLMLERIKYFCFMLFNPN